MDEVNKLIQELSSEDPEVRREAVGALGKLAATNPGNEEILKAVIALEKIAATNPGNEDVVKAVVPALIQVLKDPEKEVRSWAVWALREVTKNNPGNEEVVKAVPALLEALKDPVKDVRWHAASALENIIPHESSVEQLDKIKAEIIETLDKTDKNAPTYREMKKAAAPLIVAIYKRRNTLLSVEVNIDPAMILKRPKPPRGSGGMYRALAA